jgi:GxxExxY protein
MLPILYKEKLLTKKYTADFVCYDKIILEVKAVDKLLPQHEAQTINYLKAGKMQLGILINFGSMKLEYKRLVRYTSFNPCNSMIKYKQEFI